MKSVKMNIETVKPYWRNPRDNSGAIEEVKESIKKFGYQSQIIVDKDNVIIVGHTRFKALTQLKGKLDEEINGLSDKITNTKNETENLRLAALIKNLKEVNSGKLNILVADELNDTLAKEYRITDNKTNELSFFDQEKLKLEISELGSVIGFTEKEIGSMMNENDLNLKGITQEDMDKTQKSVTEKFMQMVNSHERMLFKIMCPECGKKFQINKEEIIKGLLEGNNKTK